MHANKNMRVAFFLGGLNSGGTETLLLDVCRNSDVVPFDFLCIHRKGGSYATAFNESPAQIVCIPKKGSWLSYILALRGYLRTLHVSIVHAQTPLNALLSAVATIGTKIHVVVTMHGFNFSHANLLYKMLVFCGCKKICFVSQYEMDYYNSRIGGRMFSKKYCVVHNGIDFEKFQEKRIAPDFISSLNTPKKFVKLAMVGSFGSGRDQKLVIEAIKILKERNNVAQLQFYFIGKEYRGEETILAECKDMVTRYGLDSVIHFMGGRDDVPAILRHIDGYVYASVHDTFGLTVIEAMASGLPVVVNDWNVMKEITNNGEWATLYRSGDAEDLALKIKELIDNIDVYKQKSLVQMDLVQSQFSIKNHVNRLNEIYSVI